MYLDDTQGSDFSFKGARTLLLHGCMVYGVMSKKNTWLWRNCKGGRSTKWHEAHNCKSSRKIGTHFHI
jgi:hypothetical protein